MLQQLAQTYTLNNTYNSPLTSSSSSGTSTGVFIFFVVLYALVILFSIITMWKLNKKAGKSGWAAVVPFYNIWVYAEVAGRPGWWGFLLFVPFVNIPIFLILILDIGQKFGKDNVFIAWLLCLLPIVGYPILAFGKSKYDRGDNSLNTASSKQSPTVPLTPPQVPAPPSTPTIVQ